MKYLIQRFSPNPMLSMVESGFYTVFKADSKVSAEHHLKEFKKVSSELTVFRIISAKDFKKELNKL